MKLIFLLFFLATIAASSCEKESEKQTEIWWINSAKVDCTGVRPTTCFQIQKSKEIESGKWELFYDQIAGFEFEPGFIYELKVEVSKKNAPVPADASSLTYELIEVISKTQDPRLALTNIWKVLHVGKFKDPKSQKGEALTVELNGSQETYFAETGCNSMRGSFMVEGVNKFRFGQSTSTMMACPNMETELELQKVLILIRKFEIENNVLYLRNESGQILMSMRAVD